MRMRTKQSAAALSRRDIFNRAGVAAAAGLAGTPLSAAPARTTGPDVYTNIGVRPTLYENYGITIESHILDFDSDVYDDTVRVYFHQLLRRERQFRSALELTGQISLDVERSRRYFARHPIRFNEIGVAT